LVERDEIHTSSESTITLEYAGKIIGYLFNPYYETPLASGK
jgi:hypothetical protein